MILSPIFTKVVTGQKVVTTAGTRVQLSAYSYLVKSLMIKALKANTGLIYIGDREVSSSVGGEISPDGIRNLIAEVDAQGRVIPIVLSDIWLDSSVDGEGVSFEFIPV